MAATEEYENQLPVQNTGKHIRALDVNGNPILIPIEEMAKVVGVTDRSCNSYQFSHKYK